MWTLLTYFSAFLLVVSSRDVSDVLEYRNCLLEKEQNLMLGSKVVLSDNERSANEIIMKLKNEVLDTGFRDPGQFNLTKHFFDYKDDVKETALYKIIKNMPKGAVLHAHDTALLGPDYILELTYLPNLYVCFHENSPLFLFSNNLPNTSCATEWQIMKEVRYSSGNVENFDEELRKHFTMVNNNAKLIYTDVNAVWVKFEQCFTITSSLFQHQPVWEQYFYDTLKSIREDNVMYIEIRSNLPQLYDLNGNVYDSVDTAISYKTVLNQFMKDYPDFFGAKLIYAPLKMVDAKTVKEYIKTARKIKKTLPDFFAGFDLVGQEDLGRPLKDFLDVLVEAEDDLDYFFHAGETNWYGTPSDENLVDAIALNTKRIGHAFALLKHPALIEEVRKKKIALEVNVISNAVLKLVDDVRNHPLATFLAMDVPVVISSDDPGLWEAEPMTHDFYVTFVGVASRHADLKLLKQLALNSLIYSAAGDKYSLMFKFEILWNKFIDNVVRDMGKSPSPHIYSPSNIAFNSTNICDFYLRSSLHL